MKKQLLSFFAAITVTSVFAQPSPDMNINQVAVFPNPTSVANPGVKFLDAVDANVVWTIGYNPFQPSRNFNWWSRSINGGSSFAGGNIFPDTNTYIIANMEGIDANTAWVSSFMKGSQNMGAIHRTVNGGTNWVNMTASGMYTNTTSFCNIVSFFNSSTGITQGDPVNGEFEIWRTTNGGLSWTPIPGSNIDNPLPGEFAIVNLYYKLGSNNLWFGTNAGRMYRTTDAGVTWSVSTVSSAASVLIEIAFSSPSNGMCTVINNNVWELWNTTNGGATWTQIPSIDPDFGYADICGVPGTGVLVSVGIGAGNEIISSSVDNGVNWTDWGSAVIPYTSVDFVNGTTGWAGSINFQTYTNVWKYSGSGITGTVSPTAAFSLPPTLCLTGPTASVVPGNSSAGSPAPTFSWSSTPSGAIFSSPTASAPTITFASGNTYTITMVATNNAGSNSSSQVIVVAPCVAPTSSFNIGATCTNYTFAAANTSTGAPAPAYFWSISPTAGTTLTPAANASNPIFKVANAGSYVITLMTSNASGTASTSQTLNVAACPPLITFTVPNPYAVCPGLIVPKEITNTTTNPPGTTGNPTYTWVVEAGAGGTNTTAVTWAPNFSYKTPTITIADGTERTYTITLKAKNLSGSTQVSQVITVDDNCTGITENGLANSLELYPNPIREQVNVVLPASSDNYLIKVTNILGSVIYQEVTSKQKTNINLANMARGVYFVTVESKTEKVTRKIVLE